VRAYRDRSVRSPTHTGAPLQTRAPRAEQRSIAMAPPASRQLENPARTAATRTRRPGMHSPPPARRQLRAKAGHDLQIAEFQPADPYECLR
jgi:hypothetical protein